MSSQVCLMSFYFIVQSELKILRLVVHQILFNADGIE